MASDAERRQSPGRVVGVVAPVRAAAGIEHLHLCTLFLGALAYPEILFGGGQIERRVNFMNYIYND